MDESLNYQLPLNRSRRWIREATPLTTGEGPRIAFKLLLFFLLLLYSAVAVIYGLEALRPAAVMAVAAIVMMFVEIGRSRRNFQFMWPQGLLLVSFLAVAFVSSFDAMWVRLAFDRTSDLVKIVLIYILIENTVTNEKRVCTVFLTMVGCGLIPAVGTIVNHFRGILIEGARAGWRGLFANPNDDAYGLVILLPLAVTVAVKSGWVVRAFLAVAMAILLVAIFLTYSRGGLMGLFAVAALIGWK